MPNEQAGGCKVCKHHEDHTVSITKICDRVTTIVSNLRVAGTIIGTITCAVGVLIMFILASFADVDKEIKTDMRQHENCVAAKMDKALKEMNTLNNKVEKVEAANKVILVYLKEIMEHSQIPVPIAVPEDK